MKIVYLVHQFYPEFQAGTEKFVFNMAYMSQKSGNKVKVITYSFSDSSSFSYRSGGILYKEFHYQGIPVLAWRYEKEPGDLHDVIDPYVDLSFANEILRQEKPDLIHSGHLMRVYPFILAAKQQNIPYILTLTDFHLICPRIILAPTPDSLCPGPDHGRNCYSFCRSLPRDFIDERLAFSTKIIQNAAAVISPSRFLARIFEYEIDDLKVITNPHGIRQSNITFQSKVYNTGDDIRFGFIGNLTRHKGVHILMNAFVGLNSKNASLSIFGAGDKAYREKLVKMSANANVKFMGTFQAAELSKVFEQIDILITPSLCYENYPFVISEAFASLVPVIASKLGGMAERIQDGNNGYLFSAGDSRELEMLLRKITTDPTIINPMKEFIRLKGFVPNIEQEAYVYNRLYQAIT